MIYLSSPYSHPDAEVREKRFQDIARIAGSFLAAGVNVFSPIAHSHPLQKYANLPATWEFWNPIDLEHLKRCDKMIVVMMDGWRESVGVKGEIELATDLGMPIEYIYAGEYFREITL
jgi:Domain of unknown function (DUF1937)